MTRILALLLLPTVALADPGLHHHPHGIEEVWGMTALLLAGGVGGWAIARLRGRK